ncbi:MYCBP-associated protein [Stegastes partitus]|uniref:MYCBP-associated protein n=1 Tax=Stegastes partitus TaxID=144197 RepID=A0A9Y4U1R0_9TELE|nr:PREDICTED: MYCBP-associated protein [Stegastes partitus]
MTHPLNLDSDSQPLDYTGLKGLQFNDQGMLLPHSILGSLEDFRSYLEAIGETELVKRIPKSPRDPSSRATGKQHSEAVKKGIPSGQVCQDLLDRSASSLLINQARETQEQREFLSQVMPLIHSGYGISGLEAIGSGKPFSVGTECRSPLPEKEDEERDHREMKKKDLGPPSQNDDGQGDVVIPSLRFCGQLASWTGNSTKNQGVVGINARKFFETLIGEIALSSLELHNEGGTVIFYSWQELRVPRFFPQLCSRKKKPHFYFNSSSGVIRPGETQQLELVFKSDEPGIQTEVWQLNTHPVLLQGASMQVRLTGVALYPDKTADQRLYVETKLEKRVTEKMCRSIVYEMVQGVRTPERPSSPAELYMTKEQQFLSKNPKLQYLDQPVEDLRRLWQEATQGRTWDYSVDSLRQVLLSLPDDEPAQVSLTREERLVLLNALLLQLSEPSDPKHHSLSAATIGNQLWSILLDRMSDEAQRLRSLLGLPEKETWIDEKDESIISDADLADSENVEKKGSAAAQVERSRARSTPKDNNKRQDKPPAQTEKSAKVYVLMEDLVDNLCDLMDELPVGHQ